MGAAGSEEKIVNSKQFTDRKPDLDELNACWVTAMYSSVSATDLPMIIIFTQMNLTLWFTCVWDLCVIYANKTLIKGQIYSRHFVSKVKTGQAHIIGNNYRLDLNTVTEHPCYFTLALGIKTSSKMFFLPQNGVSPTIN